MPLRIRRLAGPLNDLPETDLGVKEHTSHLLTPSEAHGAIGRSMKQRYGLMIPAAFHLVFVLNVYKWDKLPASDRARVLCRGQQQNSNSYSYSRKSYSSFTLQVTESYG